MTYFLGVDVGGTNSDAVLISEDKEVVTWAKEVTSQDVTSGVRDVIIKVMRQANDLVKIQDVKRISIGMKLKHGIFELKENLDV